MEVGVFQDTPLQLQEKIVKMELIVFHEKTEERLYIPMARITWKEQKSFDVTRAVVVRDRADGFSVHVRDKYTHTNWMIRNQ